MPKYYTYKHDPPLSLEETKNIYFTDSLQKALEGYKKDWDPNDTMVAIAQVEPLGELTTAYARDLFQFSCKEGYKVVNTIPAPSTKEVHDHYIVRELLYHVKEGLIHDNRLPSVEELVIVIKYLQLNLK